MSHNIPILNHLSEKLQGPELRIGALDMPVMLQEGESLLLGEGGVPVPEQIDVPVQPGFPAWQKPEFPAHRLLATPDVTCIDPLDRAQICIRCTMPQFQPGPRFWISLMPFWTGLPR